MSVKQITYQAAVSRPPGMLLLPVVGCQSCWESSKFLMCLLRCKSKGQGPCRYRGPRLGTGISLYQMAGGQGVVRLMTETVSRSVGSMLEARENAQMRITSRLVTGTKCDCHQGGNPAGVICSNHSHPSPKSQISDWRVNHQPKNSQPASVL